MPRPISAPLRRVIERHNPQSYIHVEPSAPDVGQVLRRPDQWTAPLSVTGGPPSPPYEVDERGGLTLKAQAGALASVIPTGSYPAGFDNGFWNLDAYDPSLRMKAAALQLNPAFSRVRLRTVTARVTRQSLVGHQSLTLQIYRATGVPGFLASSTPSTTTVDGKSVTSYGRPFKQWSFTPLLGQGVSVAWDHIGWGSAPGATGNTLVAHVAFNLTDYGVILDQIAKPTNSSFSIDEPAEYYFVIRPERTVGEYAWRTHSAAGAGSPGGSNYTTGVGSFRTVWWVRDSTDQEWRYNAVPDESPLIALDVDTYPTAATLTYPIDLGRAPTAGTTGRVVFERTEPGGSSATLALSTDGGSTYAAAVNEGAPAVAQQTYRARVTLTPSADHFSAPRVAGVGVEYRTAYDVSAAATMTFPDHVVAVPTLVPAVADATAQVIRIGRRDYADTPSVLASTQSPATLELDVYLASRHPSVTRGDWLKLERMSVETRDGDGVQETYRLLSLQKQLKRKVPRRTETINTALTVAAGSTTTRVVITDTLAVPVIGGTYVVGAGTYFALGYYVEVRSSSTVPVGTVYTVTDNEGQHVLRFDSQPLPAVPAAGDVLVLHSGRKALAPILWQNADPAVVMLDLITLHAEIPRERVGRNDLRNGGLPPTVVQRAPGDTTRQAALKVTRQVDQETEVAALLNSLAYLCGGAWLDVGGQLCFVQLYPLRDAAGVITVPLGPTVATFGPQDYSGLQTPSGLGARQTEVSVDYGVNTAAANPDATPTQTVSFVDADALAWHTHQDLEDAGTAKVADDVSKWLFNSADSGLALAVDAARMPVLATSTGVRPWPFTSRVDRWDLLPGDVVSLRTDQVTDFDPASKAQIRGPTAFTGPLIRTQGGRNFTMWLQGLPGNAVAVTGGAAAITGGASAAIPVPGDVLLTLNKLTTETGGNPSFAVTFSRPASPFFDHMKYRVERRRTGDTTWAPAYIVPGERAANDVIHAEWDTDYRVTPVTVSSGGTEVVGSVLPVQATGESPRAVITVTGVVVEANAIVLTYTYNQAFSFAELWTSDTASDPGTPLSLELVGAQQPDITRDPTRTTRRLVVPTSGHWLAYTLVPYNALNARNAGGIVNGKAQTSSGVVAPAAPTSAAPVSHTSTAITNTVTPSVAGSIRPYLAGSPYGADVTGAVSGTPLSITHSGLAPNTAYAFSYASVNGSGVESTTRTAAGSVTTSAGGTLPTPTITAGAYDPALSGYYVTVTNAGSFPAGTLYTINTTEGEHDTAATIFRSRASYAPTLPSGTTEGIRVGASLAGYTSSPLSTPITTVSVP